MSRLIRESGGVGAVRIIAATNIELRKAVQAREFREDLYYRLNVITLTLPPLRERKDDIPLLVSHFLKGRAVEIPEEVLNKLTLHSWPGNVRELRNVMERAVVMMEGNQLRAEDLLFLSGEKKGSEPMLWEQNEHESPESLEAIEKQVITRSLKRCKGDKKEVARILGIALSTLYEKIKRYQVDPL